MKHIKPYYIFEQFEEPEDDTGLYFPNLKSENKSEIENVLSTWNYNNIRVNNIEGYIKSYDNLFIKIHIGYDNVITFKSTKWFKIEMYITNKTSNKSNHILIPSVDSSADINKKQYYNIYSGYEYSEQTNILLAILDIYKVYKISSYYKEMASKNKLFIENYEELYEVDEVGMWEITTKEDVLGNFDKIDIYEQFILEEGSSNFKIVTINDPGYAEKIKEYLTVDNSINKLKQFFKSEDGIYVKDFINYHGELKLEIEPGQKIILKYEED